MASGSTLDETRTVSQVIEQIGSNSFGPKNIRCIRDHGICVVQSGTNVVHIYDEETKKKGLLKLPAPCTCCDVVSVQGSCHLLCGLEDDRIVSSSLQQWCGRTKKKKKKKKKHESKDKSSTLEGDGVTENGDSKQLKASSQGEGSRRKGGVGGAGGGDGSEDIFGDLLADGDCVMESMDDNIIDSPPDQAEDFYQALGHVTKGVEDNLLISKVESLEGFCVISDHLVTCSREDYGWRISVYECTLDSSNPESIKCSRTPVYSTLLVGSELRNLELNHGISSTRTSSESAGDFGGRQDTSTEAPGSDEVTSVSSRAAIHGLLSSSTRGNSAMMLHSSDVIKISNSLFDALWGSEVNLVDSPVVLVSLPDGCVYSVLLKITGSGVASSSRAQKVRLLYQSVQPVVQICSIPYTNYIAEPDRSGSKSGSDCIVLVGGAGQLVTFYNSSSDPDVTINSVHYVSGPVNAAISFEDTIVLGSDSEIGFGTFHLNKENMLQETIKHFNIPGVSALACIKRNVTCYKFLAIKKDGGVLQLSLPMDPTTASDSTGIMSAAAAGQRIKELLNSIKEISSKMAAITDLDNKHTSILKELGRSYQVVCHVAQRTDAFALNARVDNIRENGLERLKVVCEVTNGTPWTLSQGWTLVTTLSGTVGHEASRETSIGYCSTRSLPVRDLPPKATMVMSFILDEATARLAPPLSVQCSLHFDVSMLLGDTDARTDSLGDAKSCVMLDANSQGAMISIACKNLDILDMLIKPLGARYSLSTPHGRINSNSLGYGFSRDQLNSSAKTKVLFSRSSAFGDSNYHHTTSLVNQPSSVTIPIDKNILNSLSKDSTATCSRRLLELLVPSNQSFRLNGACIETETIHGCLVSIQAVESQDSDILKLHITASDDNITKRLVEAVHRRLKNTQLISAPLVTETDRLNREKRIINNQSEGVLTIRDQLAECRSSDDMKGIKEDIFRIHGNMRSQLALH